MSPQSTASQAYARPDPLTRGPRAAEYDALARVTRKLRQSGERPAAFALLARAIHDNRSLWTTFAADLAEPGNGLPADLKARLYYLAEFTLAHSRRVLAGAADATALIDINVAVMRGLDSAGRD